MEFSREDPKARFTIPDRPTVRQQLAYVSLTSGANDAEIVERFWEGAQPLIKEWECEALPKRDADLDELTDPSQTTVILWVAMGVRGHMNSLEDIEKKV